MKAARQILIALFIVSVAGFIGCSEEDDPVTPTVTMTGTWEVTWTDGVETAEGTWVLTESNGTINGTMTFIGIPGTISGTCSAQGDVMMTAYDNQDYFNITGTVNADRTTFAGNITQQGSTIQHVMTATKR